MNLSLTYGDSPRNKNFTIYTLMGSNWGALNGNISMHNANDWGQLNISSAQQEFNLINSSGSLITSLTAHLEVKVDYSLYGAKEFTFMKDISSANGTFFLPLLNTTGVKKMSIYSQSFSPKSIPSMSLSGILANPNITMTLFNPGDIGDALSAHCFFHINYHDIPLLIPEIRAEKILRGRDRHFYTLAGIIKERLGTHTTFFFAGL